MLRRRHVEEDGDGGAEHVSQEAVNEQAVKSTEDHSRGISSIQAVLSSQPAHNKEDMNKVHRIHNPPSQGFMSELKEALQVITAFVAPYWDKLFGIDHRSLAVSRFIIGLTCAVETAAVALW